MDQSILSEENESAPKSLENNTPVLIIVCGATASGKSSLALSLAQRLGCAILSADSRQVYREFSIGTAKPTAEEQNLVHHELIDICDPTAVMTVADYQCLANALIERGETVPPIAHPDRNIVATPDVRRGTPSVVAPSGVTPPTDQSQMTLGDRIPTPKLLVGGTGLYIKSIVRGMKIPRVAPQLELRSQLQTYGQKTLYAMLQQIDPISADRIHPNDPVRTLRALEVYYVTGRPITEQQGENPPTYPIVQIGLDSENLEHRIATRTRQMLDMGFEAEVKHLCNKYGETLPLLNTLGYAEMRQYLRGEISLDEAEHLIGLHTRQFAKRQRTWFRADPAIAWFDSDAPDLLDQVWQRIDQFLG